MKSERERERERRKGFVTSQISTENIVNYDQSIYYNIEYVIEIKMIYLSNKE